MLENPARTAVITYAVTVTPYAGFARIRFEGSMALVPILSLVGSPVFYLSKVKALWRLKRTFLV